MRAEQRGDCNEVPGGAEAEESDLPLPRLAEWGARRRGARWNPESPNATDSPAHLGAQTGADQDRQVVEASVAVRVLREEESVIVPRVTQRGSVYRSPRHLPRRTWDPPSRLAVSFPTELPQHRQPRDFPDENALLGARKAASREPESRHHGFGDADGGPRGADQKSTRAVSRAQRIIRVASGATARRSVSSSR